MNSLHRWLSAVLLFGMLISPAAAQLPAEVEKMANTWEFLAALAVRCDTRLTVFGYAGIREDVCTDFLTQAKVASEAAEATKDTFEKGVGEAYASRSPRVIREWDAVMNRLETSLKAVSKTRQHIDFLRQAETERQKKAPAPRKK
jgi:hypothetical protein